MAIGRVAFKHLFYQVDKVSIDDGQSDSLFMIKQLFKPLLQGEIFVIFLGRIYALRWKKAKQEIIWKLL